MVRYKVTLTKEEREVLLATIKKGRHTSKKFRDSYILLNVDEGEHSEKITNKQISDVLQIGTRTIDRLKKKFVEQGFNSIFQKQPSKRVYEKKADGDFEARLVTLACSEPPAGFAKWSLRMLADKMVQLEYVESVSHETVRKVLKKTNLSLGK